MKTEKKLKAKFHLLFHPTNIRSWILMWLFTASLILLLEAAIYYFLMTPLLDLEDFGPENIWSAFKVTLISITIILIYNHRKLFFKLFKHNTPDKSNQNTDNLEK